MVTVCAVDPGKGKAGGLSAVQHKPVAGNAVFAVFPMQRNFLTGVVLYGYDIIFIKSKLVGIQPGVVAVCVQDKAGFFAAVGCLGI